MIWSVSATGMFSCIAHALAYVQLTKIIHFVICYHLQLLCWTTRSSQTVKKSKILKNGAGNLAKRSIRKQGFGIFPEKFSTLPFYLLSNAGYEREILKMDLFTDNPKRIIQQFLDFFRKNFGISGKLLFLITPSCYILFTYFIYFYLIFSLHRPEKIFLFIETHFLLFLKYEKLRILCYHHKKKNTKTSQRIMRDLFFPTWGLKTLTPLPRLWRRSGTTDHNIIRKCYINFRIQIVCYKYLPDITFICVNVCLFGCLFVYLHGYNACQGPKLIIECITLSILR